MLCNHKDQSIRVESILSIEKKDATKRKRKIFLTKTGKKMIFVCWQSTADSLRLDVKFDALKWITPLTLQEKKRGGGAKQYEYSTQRQR